MMNVYIFNRSGSLNIGDQLIGHVLVAELQRIGYNCTVNTVYSPPQTLLEKIKTHLVSYFTDIYRIFRADVVLIGGGNLVMDSAGIGWAVHHFWISIWSLLLHKPYCYICVGVNPLRRKLSLALYQFTLRFAHKISVRDSGSLHYIKKLSKRTDICLMFDPVLMISSLYPVPRPHSNTIGICPVQLDTSSIGGSTSSYEKYVDLHVRLIEHFILLGKDVCLFVNDAVIDKQVYIDIKQRLPSNISRFRTKENFKDLADYLQFIGSFHLLISSRMHAVICAVSYGIPCIGLGWQPKMQHFFYDQSLPGHIDILSSLKTNSEVDTILAQVLETYSVVIESVPAQFSRDLELQIFLDKT